MAQDLRAAPARLGMRFALGSRVASLWRWLDLLPKSPPLGRVRYTPALVAYVGGGLAVAIGLNAWLFRSVGDWPTLAAGSTVVFFMALFAVRIAAIMRTSWTPSVLLDLGLSFTFGPAGAVSSALAESLGVAIRVRNGWFRTAFNIADHALSNLAAWAVFSALVAGTGRQLAMVVLASVCAALAHYIVNYGMLTAVLELTGPRVPVWHVVRGWLPTLPYSMGYGLAAWTLVVLHQQAGGVGLVAAMIPVVLLQAFLVIFARRVQAYEEQRAAHQKEREELLQRAVDASESERRRIARDLHDGVVQNLAGMAFTLTATASEIREQEPLNGQAEVLDVLEQSAEETRAAMKDLRTLIIEIAPPTLRREGLHAALLEVLRAIKSGGTRTRLELPSNMRLRQDRASLIFRVAQEVLRNVAAHAEAKHVSVVLREVENMAVLRITDDGKGFSAEDVARRRAEGHVGTNAIIELAEEAGGTLDIESQPGKGTRVTLRVPAE
jgi:signal transduction histidine kinase